MARTTVKDVGKLDYALGLVNVEFENKIPGFVQLFRASVDGALEEKRANYCGDEYVNQIEKNTIYGCESSLRFAQMASSRF